MISIKPYLIRSLYEWILDTENTPYLIVDTTGHPISVPPKYIQDGKLILNIHPNAVDDLTIGNEDIDFKAKFSGVGSDIFVPMVSILSIYAHETGQGMIFDPEVPETPDNPIPPTGTIRKENQKPKLKIVR